MSRIARWKLSFKVKNAFSENEVSLYKSLPRGMMVPFDVAVTYAIRAVLRVVSLLPVRLLLPITRSAGTLIWLVARRRRRIVRRNLDIAFRDTRSAAEKSRVNRRCFQHAVSCAASFIFMDRWLKKSASDGFTISPEDAAILEAGPKSRTAVLTAHAGNWEMGQLFMFLRDFPLVAFARDLGNPYLNAVLQRSRARRGGVISNTSSGELRQALRRGDNVAILADQNDHRRMHYADFFGVPAASYIGYARILLRARCRILFSVCIEENRSPLRFRLIFRELRPAGDPKVRWRKADLESESRKLVRDYLDATEEVVRQYPEQYFWMHRRWKSRPWGTPKLYEQLGRPLDPSVLEEACRAVREAFPEAPASRVQVETEKSTRELELTLCS